MVGVVGSNPIAPTSFSTDWSGFLSVINEYDVFRPFNRGFSHFLKVLCWTCLPCLLGSRFLFGFPYFSVQFPIKSNR